MELGLVNQESETSTATGSVNISIFVVLLSATIYISVILITFLLFDSITTVSDIVHFVIVLVF